MIVENGNKKDRTKENNSHYHLCIMLENSKANRKKRWYIIASLSQCGTKATTRNLIDPSEENWSYVLDL